MVSSSGGTSEEICRRPGSAFSPVSDDDIVAVGRAFETGVPLNGLRHPRQSGTSGWYIWSGKGFSAEDNFFQPLHVAHLIDTRPEVVPYLALAPSWRFLLAGEYEDLWYDGNFFDV